MRDFRVYHYWRIAGSLVAMMVAEFRDALDLTALQHCHNPKKFGQLFCLAPFFLLTTFLTTFLATFFLQEGLPVTYTINYVRQPRQTAYASLSKALHGQGRPHPDSYRPQDWRSYRTLE